MYSMIARVSVWIALIMLVTENFEPNRISSGFLWLACLLYERHCSHVKKENYNRNRH